MTDIEAAWAGLGVPAAADMNGALLPGVAPGAGCFIAMDRSGNRHLLVTCDIGTSVNAGLETRGLSVSVESLSVGSRSPGTYLAVSCLDRSLNGQFVSLVEDVRRALVSSSTPAVREVLRVVQTWRWFWGVAPAGLSDERALGLFGELWLLHRWLGPAARETVERWRGAEDEARDFEWDAGAIEVKTRGARTGPVLHRIGSLDQLAGKPGQELYLFSLHAIEDPQASNSLPLLVDEICRALATDPVASDEFLRKLALYGYSPAHSERHARGVRVVAERLYVVRDGFPRLTRESFPGGLPVGVNDVQYVLDISACEAFLVSRSADQSPF